VGIYVASGEIASRDAFISPWIVIVFFAVLAAVVSLASSAVSLLVEHLCGSRGVSTPVKTVLVLLAAALVGAGGYLIVAGWWTPAIGFVLAALLEVAAVGTAMAIAHRVSAPLRSN
jgi:SNF family Na+-dependent transporter